MQTRKLKKEKGFTLLEVMIAVFVLGVGLLGLAHLQLTALKTNQSAEYKTQAIFLASDILDRIRANQQALQQNNSIYNIGSEDSAPECSGDTSSTDCDLFQWRTNITKYLPNGSSSVNCPNYEPQNEFAICTVTINWRDIDNENGVLVIQGAIGGQGSL